MTEMKLRNRSLMLPLRLKPPSDLVSLNRCTKRIMAYELRKRGLQVRRQQPIPVVYEGIRMDLGFQADLIVENKVVVEVRSVEAIAPVHKKQVLTYLRITNKKRGILINFNVELIKSGISRVVNGL